jgi:hypothetical protein
MIWASGYIFVYSVFRKSRAWKEFDSTIKLVVGFLAGFSVELCLVLPTFYLVNMANLDTPLLLPAFDKTWIYHWLITGFVSTLFVRTKNREQLLKYLHFVFARLLFFMFFGLFLLLSILVVEYIHVYPNYILASSSTFFLYLAINWIFSVLGLTFCQFFQFFTESIYEEERMYGGRGYIFIAKHPSELSRRFFLYIANMQNRISRFLKSRWRFIPVLVGIMIIATIIPLDSYFNVFIPRVNYFANVNDPEGLVYVSLGAEFLGYNEKPTVYAKFSRTTCDIYVVTSHNYDRFGVLVIPLPSQCLGQEVKTGYFRQSYSQPQDLWAISDYSLKDNLSLTAVPSASDARGLQINYEKMKGQSFNVTLIYWQDMINDSMIILPSESKGVPFNETYDRWIQEFQIVNNSNESVYLYEVQYDRLIFEGTDKDSVEVIWNGTKMESINVIRNLVKFSPLEIKQQANGTLLIDFLSTNKFPR